MPLRAKPIPMTPPRTPAAADGAVISVRDLARLLNLERKSVYAAIRRGEIPGVRRVGRCIRVCRATVLAWLRDGQGLVSRSPKRS
jgi:excisionase family DNA binding protein